MDSQNVRILITKLYTVTEFNLYDSMVKFSRRQIHAIFLIFPRKQEMIMQIASNAWNIKSCFLEKNKINTINMSSAGFAQWVVKVKLLFMENSGLFKMFQCFAQTEKCRAQQFWWTPKTSEMY